jgi:hypothetical protein
MDELPNHYIGHFKVGRRSLPGTVTLARSQSRFEVFSNAFIHIEEKQKRAVRGISSGGERLTVIDAVGSDISGSRSYYNERKEFLSLFPHYVAIGPRHLEVAANIAEISFTTDGALSIFYDIGAFGSAQFEGIRKLMPDWTKKDRRKIDHSTVFYYADRGPIITVNTPELSVRAWNAVSYKYPSPAGINLDNEVRVTLAFSIPASLADALGAAYDLRAFLEIVSQAKQCLHNFTLRHKGAGDEEFPLRLYVSLGEEPGRPSTDFRDNLVSGGLHKQEFQKVLARWLATQKEMRSSRKRISEGVREGLNYTVDRLVGAANAFDLLPLAKVGKRKLPTSVLKHVSRLSAELDTMQAPYRDLIRGNLNLIKGQNLRTKIETRFKALPTGVRAQFPEMSTVIDHCVRARNFFVHGSAPKLSVDQTYHHLPFFTDALEFIFVASDLYECGWKPTRWLHDANLGRLREFARQYERNKAALNSAP